MYKSVSVSNLHYQNSGLSEAFWAVTSQLVHIIEVALPIKGANCPETPMTVPDLECLSVSRPEIKIYLDCPGIP